MYADSTSLCFVRIKKTSFTFVISGTVTDIINFKKIREIQILKGDLAIQAFILVLWNGREL